MKRLKEKRGAGEVRGLPGYRGRMRRKLSCDMVTDVSFCLTFLVSLSDILSNLAQLTSLENRLAVPSSSLC